MKAWAQAISAVAAVVIIIQFVPVGKDHTNPPVTAEPHWSSPGERALYQRACFDCHSNETAWPWYSHIAPVSWMVSRDVNDGRRHMNFSTWTSAQRHGKDIAREVSSGDMPLWFYLPMHPAARLTAAEKAEMLASAATTFGPQQAPLK